MYLCIYMYICDCMWVYVCKGEIPRYKIDLVYVLFVGNVCNIYNTYVYVYVTYVYLYVTYVYVYVCKYVHIQMYYTLICMFICMK